MKIPVGPERGRGILDVTVAQLEAACDDVDARLCAEPKGTDKARTRKLFVRAARDLLRKRKFPAGSYADTESANRALRDAAEVGYLISPSDQVARVLEGTEIVLSAYRADVQLDTFADDEHPGRRVPGKALLDRIANALGLSWDAANCRRIDGMTHPHVRAAQAAALLKNFDGSDRALQASGEIDLTQGSALAKAILARLPDNRGRVELERRREYIGSHVDTTARLRVIRQLGLRDSYLPTELAKPFFVARVVFTGRTENPAAQQVFAERVADAFLPARSALFGRPKVAGGQP